MQETRRLRQLSNSQRRRIWDVTEGFRRLSSRTSFKFFSTARRHLQLVISGKLNCIILSSQIFTNPKAVAKRQLQTIQLRYVPPCLTP
jgi:hypothetical protein